MFQQPVPSGAPLEDWAEREQGIKGRKEVRYCLRSPRGTG